MIFQCNKESTRLKQLLKQATTANQEFRLFLVQRRDEKTLLPIIKRKVTCESDIHWDEWWAYSKLNQKDTKFKPINW